MRFTLVGLILATMTTAAFAQAEGEVESIGFGGCYRPNCWTPMKLLLKPTTGAGGNYQIQVVQEDMDRDRAVYSRPLALSGNAPGNKVEEHAWVYFLPQPRELRAASGAQLGNIIRVFLCNESGTKQLVQLAIPSSVPQLVDLDASDGSARSRGTRLVLIVQDGSSELIKRVYNNARGVTEDVAFVTVRSSDLPGNPAGYQAVDWIVWLNADPLKIPSDTMAALEEYVKDGGRLLVCQNADDWQKMVDSELYPLLPVTLESKDSELGAASLRRLAGLPDLDVKVIEDPWADIRDKPTPITRATAKSTAVVDMASVSNPASPYLARWMVGYGQVAWVAQDLGSPAVVSKTARREEGWEKIWDKVFDWPNKTIPLYRAKEDAREAEAYGPAGDLVDLSSAMLSETNNKSTGAALVALAVVFFLGYWVIAGPGSFFFLQSRKQAHYSWPAFAVCAIAAAALTGLVVKLVVRGPPELRHLTFVRVAAGQDALVRSQIGLYIKGDGPQTIELAQTAAKRDSYLIPYPVHPDQLRDTGEFLAPIEYQVPMRDRNAAGPPQLEVTYRSTAKKFAAQWIGEFGGAIDGRATLKDTGGFVLQGTLTNYCGRDLQNVYVVYTNQLGADVDPYVLSFAEWKQGESLDLAHFAKKSLLNSNYMASNGWGADFGNMPIGGEYANLDRAAVLMSVFDRLAPSSSRMNQDKSRFELLRRAGRQLDASSAISCGQMLIIARADGPLPFPLQVEGDRVPGDGTVYYQFVVPIDRIAPETQPADSKKPEGKKSDNKEPVAVEH